MTADILIFVDGHRFVARNAFSQQPVAEGRKAHEVIQKAIDALPAQGGTVALSSGSFPMDQPAKLRSGSTLRGSGRSTLLSPTPANKEGICILLHELNRALVSDLSCEGRQADGEVALVVLHHCGDSEVRNVFARNSGGCGILVRQDSFMTKLMNNTTSGNKLAGTRFWDNNMGRGGDWPPQLAVGCTSIGDEGDGFHVSKTFCTNLVGCQAYQARGYGFHVDRHANSTCLSGCRTYQGLDAGVKIEDSHEINISSSIICWNKGGGIILHNVTWGTVSANNAIDNGGRTAPAYGILLSGDTKTLQITGNAVFNWPGHHPMLDGIHEQPTCSNNQIVGNNISYYKGKAVVCQGKDSHANNNHGIKDAYIHPDGGPDMFPKDENGIPIPKVLEEFDTVRVDAFLAARP